MSGEVRFFSNLQTGLAAALDTVADDQGVPSAAQSSVAPQIGIAGISQTFSQTLELLGPSSVMRVDANAIKMTVPKPNDQDVAPNFFPYVEFHDASLPWMFTPARPNSNGRLMPWLVLVVVEKSDQVSLRRIARQPGMMLSISGGAGGILPKLIEAYAWGHVEDRSGASDPGQAFADHPEDFSARLMCPVRMSKNKAYIAALVPAFEAGRQAGLGREVTEQTAAFAWVDETEALDLPAFHHWEFATGEADFEALVRMLQGIPVDESVGLRDLDISNPEGGLNIGSLLGQNYADDNILVSYQGALLSPIAAPRAWPVQHRTAFEAAIHDDLTVKHKAPANRAKYQANAHDPVITAPLYGSFQRDPESFEQGNIRWMNTLNLDPQYRANAGLGARSVRRNQEKLMGQAWARAQAIEDVQTHLRQGRVALCVGTRLHGRLSQLPTPQYVQITTPMQANVPSAPGTMETAADYFEDEKNLPDGVLSATFRRSASLTETRVKGIEFGAQNLATLQTTATQVSLSGEVATFDTRLPDLDAGSRPFVPYTMGTVELNPALSLETLANRVGLDLTPGAKSATGPVFAKKGLPGTPKGTSGKGTTGKGTTGTNVAVFGAIKNGVKPKLQNTSPVTPTISVTPTKAQTVKTAMVQATKPATALAPRVVGRVSGLVVPPSNRFEVPRSGILTVRFEEPAYEFINKTGAEFLLPGFGEVADHSVSLLVTNSSFVESFLLGLNHELSREFAWRQFPAALDSTWYHRFWDYLGEHPKNDITPITNWPNTRQLGAGTSENDAVILVKSPLFRRFPETLVYAVPGKWVPLSSFGPDEISQLRRTGAITASQNVRIADFSDASRIMTPSFSGRIAGTAAFFGFATDPLTLVGTPDPESGTGDPGYFIVFEQAPTHQNFGLDQAETFTPRRVPTDVDDLSWGHFAESEDALSVLSHATVAPKWWNKPIEGSRWGNTSAETAKLAMQSPVRVMFHTSGLVDMEGLAS